jgi:DNA-binding NtrC family response regulator
VTPVTPATKKSIVLVDDEQSYNDLMRQLLSDNLDCPVHGFIRPRAALQALPVLDPGVIVSDYFMPEMSGLDFIRQASDLAPAAAFVLISGNNLTAESDRIAALPRLRGVLAKPFGWRKLADEILRVWPADIAAPASRTGAPSR